MQNPGDKQAADSRQARSDGRRIGWEGERGSSLRGPGRWRTAVAAAVLLALALGGTPTKAGPLDQRVVTIANQFVPAEVTLTKGEALEYTNLEPTLHNLIALRLGKDGKPVFRTDTIGAATTVVVEGLDKLDPGVYDFTCTLHPRMFGTIYLEASVG